MAAGASETSHTWTDMCSPSSSATALATLSVLPNIDSYTTSAFMVISLGLISLLRHQVWCRQVLRSLAKGPWSCPDDTAGTAATRADSAQAHPS